MSFKIEIKKNGQITNVGEAKTRAQVQKWFQDHREMGSFGKEEHFINGKELTPEVPAVLDEDGKEISPYIPATYEQVKVPAEFEASEPIELEDEEQKREAKNAARKALQKSLKDVDTSKLTLATVKDVIKNMIDLLNHE